MKIAHRLTAAGIAIASLGITAAPAEARDGWNGSRYDHRYDRRDDRRWHNDRRWRDGRGWYGNHRNRCWTEWRRGHRVRVCR